MKNFKRLSMILICLILFTGVVGSVYATESHVPETTDTEASTDAQIKSAKAKGSAIAIGLAALGAAIAMGIAVAKALEGISRQPEAYDKIRTSLMLGLVFIETVIIYALIIAILVIFVL